MMKSQTFLQRITTFFMSVLLFSTFFFPLMSQPAWANKATPTTVQNSAQPLCTAESRALGKSECNINIDDRHITYNNDSHDTYKNDSQVIIVKPDPPNTTRAWVGGAAVGALLSVSAVMDLSVADMIGSGLAAVGGVVGSGMAAGAAGVAVSAALPVAATVGVGFAAYQGVKMLTSSHNKRKVDQSQQ
ncbi:hypothetical protein [Lyngbya sp. PCC 8106]|uniref:hypothetical protein n=1 Tax=Lyngbya sp. (strain PCC 8106) TaxID=313612 RepID=UPI0012E9DB71|nr:hypothetical protein [Lyngbya sp. PCC 8106]